MGHAPVARQPIEAVPDCGGGADSAIWEKDITYRKDLRVGECIVARCKGFPNSLWRRHFQRVGEVAETDSILSDLGFTITRTNKVAIGQAQYPIEFGPRQSKEAQHRSHYKRNGNVSDRITISLRSNGFNERSRLRAQRRLKTS